MPTASIYSPKTKVRSLLLSLKMNLSQITKSSDIITDANAHFYDIPENSKRKFIKVYVSFYADALAAKGYVYLRLGKQFLITESFTTKDYVYLRVCRDISYTLLYFSEGKDCYKGSINICFGNFSPACTINISYIEDVIEDVEV